MLIKTASFFCFAALSSCFFLPAAANAQAALSAQTTGKKVPLDRVLQAMQAGQSKNTTNHEPFVLVVESSVAKTPVSFEPSPSASLETQLDALVKELPKGTRWVKLLLPPPPPGKMLKGDDVADFALAQARLFGSVGETVLPVGSVEVLSQTVPLDKAATVIPALHLQPVYLIINPPAHSAMIRGVRDFADLTPQQQKQWAKNAAPSFQSMTPKERVEAFLSLTTQLSSLIEAATEGLSDEQIKQLFGDTGGTGK